MSAFDRIAAVSVIVAITCCSQAIAVPQGTAFTYQGRLLDNNAAANGLYDFDFRLFDAAAGGNQVGADMLLNDVSVSGGLFTVQLDFGNVFGATAVWLDIGVRPGASGASYTALVPRQTLTAAPFAQYALHDSNWHTLGAAMSSSNTGFVGIGRIQPISGSEFFGVKAPVTSGYGGMYIDTNATNTKPFYGYSLNGSAAAWTEFDGASSDWNVHNGGTRLTVASNGYVGVGRASGATSAETFGVQSPSTGTNYGGMYVHTAGTTAKPFYGYDTGNWTAWTYLDGTTHDFRIYNVNDRVTVTAAGNVGIGTNTPAQLLDVNGTARVRVLEIVGADMAEKFPFCNGANLEPGMVVMIDAANPGKLCLAQGAYNKKVAGILSGANGLPAGTILGHLPGSDDAPPIALSGRVWVSCDATEAAIAAGDLLTTSDTPGHAMKAIDESRAFGAVIGKAMTELKQGETGMVLVLVNLQ
jgi:hypothetical protein